MASSQQVRWRKSSRSAGNGGNCVELAHTFDALRDSKNPRGPMLRGDVARLVAAVRAGEIG
jgi:hypothetical protein